MCILLYRTTTFSLYWLSLVTLDDILWRKCFLVVLGCSPTSICFQIRTQKSRCFYTFANLTTNEIQLYNSPLTFRVMVLSIVYMIMISWPHSHLSSSENGDAHFWRTSWHVHLCILLFYIRHYSHLVERYRHYNLFFWLSIKNENNKSRNK